MVMQTRSSRGFMVLRSGQGAGPEQAYRVVAVVAEEEEVGQEAEEVRCRSPLPRCRLYLVSPSAQLFTPFPPSASALYPISRPLNARKITSGTLWTSLGPLPSRPRPPSTAPSRWDSPWTTPWSTTCNAHKAA
ncbi:hypothetical protein BASA81_007902 [Batrachochytrium salamandrivorans]|nr:hypothetical protein BASA81_007902 [Batrachochytrium salamandrivorans]